MSLAAKKVITPGQDIKRLGILVISNKFGSFQLLAPECLVLLVLWHTVDGQNPAPVDMVVYPIFYRVWYIPGGCLGFLPSTVLLVSKSSVSTCFGSAAPFLGHCLPLPSILSAQVAWLSTRATGLTFHDIPRWYFWATQMGGSAIGTWATKMRDLSFFFLFGDSLKNVLDMVMCIDATFLYVFGVTFLFSLSSFWFFKRSFKKL